MIKLHCNHSYQNGPRHLQFEAGHHYDVPEEVAEFLFIDSPGSFAIVRPVKTEAHAPRGGEIETRAPRDEIPDEVQQASLDEPPHDTSIKRAPRAKRVSG